MSDEPYDPFARGRFPVGVRTLEAFDPARERTFPCELWYPAADRYRGQDLTADTQDRVPVPQGDAFRSQAAVRDAGAEPGARPFIVFSHSSGGGRRQSTFLCTHLASHGYAVAALDHSEAVAPELARGAGESDEQRNSRQAAWIASRVPDVRFCLDYLSSPRADPGVELDATRVGIVGHSFGGWTALAAPDVDDRVLAVVALAPAGSSTPVPGMLAARLAFAWQRDVPTLYLAAENDVSMPLEGIRGLVARTPGNARLVVLRNADHLHFMDEVEALHEAVRGMSFPGELAWLPKAMQPIGELCSGEQAHVFVRGLTLCHLDATLGEQERARKLLSGAVEAELARRGVDGFAHAS
jgi:dienelactone hydrolase